MTRLEKANDKSILQVIGSYGLKVKGSGRWRKAYSPFRSEKDPSFLIDVPRNKWFDPGASDLTKGFYGSVVDFVALMDGCSTGEAITTILQDEKKYKQVVIEEPKPGIVVVSENKIKDKHLIDYIEKERGIDIDLCRMYCKEVEFKFPESRFPEKLYKAIGFPNKKGGWELRSKWHKKSTSPKTFSLLDGTNNNISLYEGFIDFLTALCYFKVEKFHSNIIVLNSVSNRAYTDQIVMGAYRVFDYLDLDNSGDETRNYYKSLDVELINCTLPYKGYNDFNEMWVEKKINLKNLTI